MKRLPHPSLASAIVNPLMDLPYVFLNVAMTADGKISPFTRRFAPFTSKEDRRLLIELRSYADAVMAGARTADSVDITLGPGGQRFRDLRVRRGLSAYNLRILVSGSGTIDTEAEVFQHRFSPLLVLTTTHISGSRLKALRAVADEVKMIG